ncbi:MAG: hypothetical protein R3C42_05975 [Parvularculaceae bacterium]|nr:hypothetical protein [Parvularculaceae bacterium]
MSSQAESSTEAPSGKFGRPRDLDPVEYNRLIDAAELQDIRLVSSNFFVEPEYYDPNNAENRVFGIEDSITEPEFDDESNALFAAFEFIVKVQIEEKLLLSCTASYVVGFRIEGQFDLDLMKYFARRIGRNATYPYFRDHAAQLSWASGAQLPILPIMKTGSAKKSAAQVSGVEAASEPQNTP